MTLNADSDPLRPVAVEPRDGYHIWLRYADGTEGVVDLSDLAGKGVFAAWLDRQFFRDVWIAEGGEIVWRNEIELCRHAFYFRLTGKTPEQVFPGLRHPASA